MANFDSEFFGLVFPGLQATQKIHAQNSRPELSAFLSDFTFLNPKFIHGDFLLTGETKIFGPNTIFNKTCYLPVATCLAPPTDTPFLIAEKCVDKDKSTGWWGAIVLKKVGPPNPRTWRLRTWAWLFPNYKISLPPLNFCTSAGNYFLEFSRIVQENYYCQYLFLPVLRHDAWALVAAKIRFPHMTYEADGHRNGCWRGIPEKCCEQCRASAGKKGSAGRSAGSSAALLCNRDRGVKTHRKVEGGELAPEVVLGTLGLLTPKLRIVYRISVERGQCRDPRKFKIFTPPLIFRDLTPPIPVSNSLRLFW